MPSCFASASMASADADGCLTAAMVEIEHGIDHRARLCRGVPDQIAHGVGRLVEKATISGFAVAVMTPSYSVAWPLTYILEYPNLAIANLWSRADARTNRPSTKAAADVGMAELERKAAKPPACSSCSPTKTGC